MGKCSLCARPMNEAEGCIDHRIILRNGTVIEAPSHDVHGSLDDEEPDDRCHDCGAQPGGVHHRHCDWARVPQPVIEHNDLDHHQVLTLAVGYVPPDELPDADVPVAGFYDERIDMAHWYPKLRDLAVPTPYTERVEWEYDDGTPTWETNRVADKLMDSFGGEAFVRSGYKSAQLHHSGGHIRYPEDIDETLTELCAQHTMMGMPVGEALWIREYLDLDFCGYARENLVPEVRAFIRDGEVVCHHPRLEGFDKHPDHRESAVEYIDAAWEPREPAEYEDRDEPRDGLKDYAERVAAAFDGWWSVDFVMDRGGEWYCTDMALDALADKGDGQLTGISAHPDDCEHDVETIAYE